MFGPDREPDDDQLQSLLADLERLLDLADGKPRDWRGGRSAYAAVATEVMSLGRPLARGLRLALAYRQALEQLRAQPGRHPRALPDPRNAEAFLAWSTAPHAAGPESAGADVGRGAT